MKRQFLLELRQKKKPKEFNNCTKVATLDLLWKIMMKSQNFFRKACQCKRNVILDKRIFKRAKNHTIINSQILYGRNDRWRNFSQRRK